MNKCLALCIGIALLAGGLTASGAESNGKETSSDVTPAAKLTVSVLDSAGAIVTSVKPSDPWTYVVYGYWIAFTGSTWTLAEINVYVLNSSGLPQKVIETRLTSISNNPASIGLAPFAIGNWGGSVHGSLQIQVRTFYQDQQTGYVAKSLDLL